MLAKLLSILLVAAMLACPYRCRQVGSACSEEVAAPACCEHCACRQQRSDTQSPQAPHLPHDGPCDDCQCICGGAIVKDSTEYEVLLHFAFMVDLHPNLSEALSAGLLDPIGHPPPDRLPDDHAAPSGRDLCCLHMTFLC